jgi:hypothetical protein
MSWTIWNARASGLYDTAAFALFDAATCLVLLLATRHYSINPGKNVEIDGKPINKATMRTSQARNSAAP